MDALELDESRPAKTGGSSPRLAEMGALGILLRKARRSLVEQMDAKLKPFGITYSLYAAIACLSRSGAMQPVVLARELVIDAGALTRCLDRAVAMGLVCREYTPHDRRSVIVSLSAEGQQLVASLQDVLSEVLDANLVGISSNEIQGMLDLMGRIVANGKNKLTCD